MYSGLRPVRTLCMLSIVAFHVRWSAGEVTEPLLGVSFGLTTLQVILCALVARGAREVPARTFLNRRAGRLLRPWVLWSAIYMAVKVAQSVRYGHPWNAQLDADMWLVGGAFHLWFLPYGLAASLAAFALLRMSRGPLAAGGALVAAAAGGLTLLLSTRAHGVLAPSPPLDLWLDGLPALFFGVAMGRALSVRRGGLRRALLATTCLVAVGPLVAGAAWTDPSPLWARYAIAVPLATLGFGVRMPSVSFVTWLAERNMGVYVVHILALQLVDRLALLHGLADGPRILAVYGLSLGLVSGLAGLAGVARRWFQGAAREEREDSGRQRVSGIRAS